MSTQICRICPQGGTQRSVYVSGFEGGGEELNQSLLCSRYRHVIAHIQHCLGPKGSTHFACRSDHSVQIFERTSFPFFNPCFVPAIIENIFSASLIAYWIRFRGGWVRLQASGRDFVRKIALRRLRQFLFLVLQFSHMESCNHVFGTIFGPERARSLLFEECR